MYIKLKRTALAALLLTGGICIQAQDLKDCFREMPDSLCPLLSAINRADCIDFMESGMKAEVTNNLGGKSEMTLLAPDYLALKMSAQTFWQMKMLTLPDSTQVICTVSTACAAACDSHIAFYTTQWEPLPADRFLPERWPVADDFIAEAADTTSFYRYQEARRQADITLLKAELNPKEPLLTLTFSTPDYMAVEARETLAPYLKQPLTLVWREGRFQP